MTFIGTVRDLSLFWFLHLLPILFIGVPIWILAHIHERVKWNILDFLIVIVPFLVWNILMFTSIKIKGIGNITEGFLIGIIIITSPIIRVVIGDKVNQVKLSSIILIILSITAAGVYVFIPATIE